MASAAEAKEMRPVLKLKPLRASDPQEGLVDQRGWLQRVTGALGSHFLNRDGPQFRVNQVVKLV